MHEKSNVKHKVVLKESDKHYIMLVKPPIERAENSIAKTLSDLSSEERILSSGAQAWFFGKETFSRSPSRQVSYIGFMKRMLASVGPVAFDPNLSSVTDNVEFKPITIGGGVELSDRVVDQLNEEMHELLSEEPGM